MSQTPLLKRNSDYLCFPSVCLTFTPSPPGHCYRGVLVWFSLWPPISWTTAPPAPPAPAPGMGAATQNSFPSVLCMQAPPFLSPGAAGSLCTARSFPGIAHGAGLSCRQCREGWCTPCYPHPQIPSFLTLLRLPSSVLLFLLAILSFLLWPHRKRGSNMQIITFQQWTISTISNNFYIVVNTSVCTN